MLLTRMYLRNYRVYADELELELPPGLIGIYGPNGGGKSTLVEAIRFTLFGRSRTANDEIRTAGVNSECVAEIEFEHEGHLYMVRRTVSGSNSTVKALAHADGSQVAEGVRDTGRYVQSILGMDDTSFRASVFAEQKQLAAFSEQAPNERRRLVLQLLGITPLDSARDLARRDARLTQSRFEELRNVLPDLGELSSRLKEAEEAAARYIAEATDADKAANASRTASVDAQQRYDALDRARQEYERLVALGKAARTDHERASAAVEKLTAELVDLEGAAARLEALAADAEGWRDAEARLRAMERVLAARVTLDGIGDPGEVLPPDEAGCEQARSAADDARAALAALAARLDGARADRDRAEAAGQRSAELTPGADCPLCGQALGDAFEAVQAHRAAEVAEAEARLSAVETEHVAAANRAASAARIATEAARALKAARERWAAAETIRTRRAAAITAVEEAGTALAAITPSDTSVGPAEVQALAAEVDRRRRAADDVQRIRGRLERRDAAAAELDIERAAVAEATGRLESLRTQLAGIGFRTEDLDDARRERDTAQRGAEVAATAAQQAHVAAGTAAARVEAEARRLDDARVQHAKLEETAQTARHLVRLADLLNAFRNTLVATVGPRLSAQAAELFAELTDHEYDDLSVDPDTYEIKVRDAGLLYGMSRFSGSETDLANLALRVAVSEQVRFQAGGAVGLLVLDEVFGPLDDERKERMLLALQRLRARFRQVLVVTHDAAVKEQLPAAIEVVKLPGRRATARLVNG